MHALIRSRAKSIDAAPVGYFCSNGAALAPRRHCELCLHLSTEQIERFEKVAIYLVRAAHSVPSDACRLGPLRCKTCGFARSNSCEAGRRAAHRDR